MAKITGFRVKDGVYQANIVAGGNSQWRAVRSQNGHLYVNTGSKLTGDLVRYDFSDRLADRFEKFVCTGKDIGMTKPPNTENLLGENLNLISGKRRL